MRFMIICIMLFSTSILAQENTKTRFSIFYFGGSDCPYCNVPKNIGNIKKIKLQFPKRYKDMQAKFVMVVMDDDIKQGQQYLKKYGYWDEISIGQRYNNELMIEHVNRSRIPGIPHIMVYKDFLVMDSLNIPTVSKRALLKDLVGGKAIDVWVKDSYPLDNYIESANSRTHQLKK
jgi:hypothetical protein